MSDQTIYDAGDLRKYRAEIPHMADDDLDVYEYRLYGHYKRVCGEGGVCFESLRTTAEKTRMSHPQVVKTRRALTEKGYIQVEEIPGQTTRVTLVDLWPKNMARYAGGHVVSTPGHVVSTKNPTTTPTKSADAQSVQRLYEQNIGPATPIIQTELEGLVSQYGFPHVEAAIQEAVRWNKRRLSTVIRVCHDSFAEGRWPGEYKDRPKDSSTQDSYANGPEVKRMFTPEQLARIGRGEAP